MISYFKTPKPTLCIAALYPIAIATSMGLMEILNVLWALFGLIYIVLNRDVINFKSEFKKMIMTPELPIVLFILWGAFSTLSQENLTGTLSHHFGPLRIFIIYFAARFTFQTLSRLTLGTKLLYAAASLGFIQAIVQHITGKDFIKPHKVLIQSTFGFGTRSQGFFNNPLTFSNAYLPFVLIAFAALLFSWKRYYFKVKTFLIIFSIVGVVALTASASRYLIYTAPFCLLIIVFLKKWKTGVTFAVIGVLSLVAIYYSSPSLQGKVSQMANLNYQSNSHRIKLYEAYWNVVKDNPWIGIGINNEKLASDYIYNAYGTQKHVQTGHSHNHFLQTLAEMGIPGLLLFLWFNFQFFYYLVKAFKKAGCMQLKGILAAGISIFINFHVSGLTQNTYGDSEVAYGMFFFMGVVMMMAFNIDRIQENDELSNQGA